MSQGSAPSNLFRGYAPSNHGMATSSGSGEWVVKSDPRGLPYFFNTVTQRAHSLALNNQGRQTNSLLPEAVSVGFNTPVGSQRYPDAVSDAGRSWTPTTTGPSNECTDSPTRSQYWHNEGTRERTWDSPTVDNKSPRLPPRTPSPPTSPPPRKVSAPYATETRDQWSRYTNIMGAAVWYNSVTGKAQKNKPRCMMKYR